MASPFSHRVAQVRVLGIELVILAARLMLYPTGLPQEPARVPAQGPAPVRGGGRHEEQPDAPCPPGHPHAPDQEHLPQDAGHEDGCEDDDEGGSGGATRCEDGLGGRGPGRVLVPGQRHRQSAGDEAHLTDRRPVRAQDDTARRFAAASAHPPVLLLHGFVDNRSVFALLRRTLVRNGWRHVHALNYSPLTWDIRKAAALLGRHVDQLCEQTGHRRIDIVGHSLGGLIARYYVQRLGGDLRVRTVVTLGTPHSGTTVGPLFDPHPVVRQMRPGSELLNELAGPAPGCTTRFIAIWSDLDQMMAPVETARLDHPDLLASNVLVPGLGHLTLPVHSGVAAQIRLALSGGGEAAGGVAAA